MVSELDFRALKVLLEFWALSDIDLTFCMKGVLTVSGVQLFKTKHDSKQHYSSKGVKKRVGFGAGYPTRPRLPSLFTPTRLSRHLLFCAVLPTERLKQA